jgi:hypothetical protein
MVDSKINGHYQFFISSFLLIMIAISAAIKTMPSSQQQTQKSVINYTNVEVWDEKLQFAIRAINRQVKEDFESYWSLGATLRLEGRSSMQPNVEIQ